MKTNFRFKTVEEYQHQIENVEAMELQFRKEHERLVRECGEKTESLREQIGAIQKPYNEKIEQIDRSIEAYQKQRFEFQRELLDFKDKKVVIKCKPCNVDYGQAHNPRRAGEYNFCPRCGTKLIEEIPEWLANDRG